MSAVYNLQHICTWSQATLPDIIYTSWSMHICFSSSLALSATFPINTLFLYFGIHIRCTFRSYFLLWLFSYNLSSSLIRRLHDFIIPYLRLKARDFLSTIGTLKRIRDNRAEEDCLIEKGIKQGKAEGKFEIAKNMLSKNYPISDIFAITGLSQERTVLQY